MRVHGPRRKIVGELLHSDGDLYSILECGHVVRGKYNASGMEMTKARMCMHCAARIYHDGHGILVHSVRFGFLADPDAAIRSGQNISLWDELLPFKFNDINEKYLGK